MATLAIATILLCGLFILRNDQRYVGALDIAICSSAVLIVLWMIAVWLSRPKTGGIMARRLRFILFLCAMGPFVYFFITAVNDITARRMSLFSSGIVAVQSSGYAHQVLGSPIVVGWPSSLSGEYSSSSGRAVVLIPIAGSKKKAALYVSGVKQNGTWSIKNLYLVQAGTNATAQITIPITTATAH